ncbi:MAG TPA: glutamine amidotransferase [archaeon]|nr:glutamine amidotransferase [archaeon]
MSEDKKVLYMGDDSLQGAAAYLGGVLAHAGIGFSYCPSSEAVSPRELERASGLFIISDYPSKNLSPAAVQSLVRSVNEGTSFLMIGGWESFHGLKGGYHQGPIAGLLPVECRQADDRINWCQGVVPKVAHKHPCLEGLPWDEPPIFCGFNGTSLKEGAVLALSARLLKIQGDRLSFLGEECPLLVFGRSGKGKTCALTTDLAPHWVGGWVDWGEPRINAQAPKGGAVEVGVLYAKFITQLVSYLLTA